MMEVSAMPGYEAYVKAWRARLDKRRTLIEQQRQRHLTLAKRIANELRTQLGVRRVYVFGSLADGVGYDERSDIDLAVEGIPVDQQSVAWDIAESICLDTGLDFVFLEEASVELRRRVMERGVEL